MPVEYAARYRDALGVPLPKVLRTAAEFDVNMQVRRMAAADDLTRRRARRAFVTYPDFASGSSRDEAALLRAENPTMPVSPTESVRPRLTRPRPGGAR